jgi:hypothetical protein
VTGAVLSQSPEHLQVIWCLYLEVIATVRAGVGRSLVASIPKYQYQKDQPISNPVMQIFLKIRAITIAAYSIVALCVYFEKL